MKKPKRSRRWKRLHLASPGSTPATGDHEASLYDVTLKLRSGVRLHYVGLTEEQLEQLVKRVAMLQEGEA